MDNEVKVLNYLPEVLQDSKAYIAISEVQGPMLSSVCVEIEQILDNQFLLSADENGLARWEDLLGLSVKATNTIDDRRFRILSRLNGKLPYTITRLKEQMSVLCGEDSYSIELQADNYKLLVRIALSEKEQYLEAESILNNQLPANILLDLSLLYNTYEVLGGYTYSSLSAYTNKQLKEEVIS